MEPGEVVQVLSKALVEPEEEPEEEPLVPEKVH